MKLRILCTSAAAIALFAFPAFSQNQGQAQPTRVRGVIQSFDGQVMQIKADDGKMTTVAVPENLPIRANARATLADIKPGDFVASAADKGADGKIHAEELRIFPEAMRGAGGGHRPMGPNPDRTMTNGTVAMSDPEARTMTNGTVSATGAAGSRSITVKYKEGETVITVDPETPITRIMIADRTLLKPGATVSVQAAQKDGALVATNVTAEKDGVKP
jgi:hypothetical protein